MDTTDQHWAVISAQITQATTSRGWHQGDLAEAMGVSRATVWGDLQARVIPHVRLAKYCEIFGWSLARIEDFLGLEDGNELAVAGARADYVRMVHALEGLVYTYAERDEMFGAAAAMLGKRYRVDVALFNETVRRARQS